MNNLLKNSFIVALQLIMAMPSICMEQQSTNWDELNNQGPLAELKFEEESVDDQGNHYGWLYSKEFNDHVYVMVTPHRSGYYIDYVDPKYKKTLPYGFYYWKSTNNVKTNPRSQISYFVVMADFSTAPVMINEWDLSSYSQVHTPDEYKHHRSITKTLERTKRSDRYKELRSFEKSFKGPTNVYLIEPIQSAPIPQTIIDKIRALHVEGAQYRFFSENDKRQILDAVPENIYRILKERLENKLKDSGLKQGEASEEFALYLSALKQSESAPQDEESFNENLKDYILNERRVIDQYIIEDMINELRQFLRGYSDTAEIDPYKILENIEKLDVCPSEIRKEFEEIVEARGRYVAMTAEGIIMCNPGILQWD